LPVVLCGSVRASEFTPASLSPALWLRSGPTWQFSDTGGTTPITDAVAVARWLDASGNGRHLTQSTTGNRPVARQVSGVWTTRFGPTAHGMAFDAPWSQVSPITVYAKWKQGIGWPGDQSLLNRDNGPAPAVYATIYSRSYAASFYWDGPYPMGAPIFSAGVTTVARWRAVSASVIGVRFDRDTEVTESMEKTTLGNWVRIGDVQWGQYPIGDLTELIVIQGAAVSAGDDDLLLTYLGL